MKDLLRAFRASGKGKDKVCTVPNDSDEHITSPATMLTPSHPASLAPVRVHIGSEPTPAPPTPLTVIELFQSQGCSSCPPANTNVLQMLDAQTTTSQEHGLLVLTFEVTYWDYLGWPDTFGDARWDARQREYAATMRSRSVYTPQVIVNGTAAGVGARPSELAALVRDGASGAHAHTASISISPSSPAIATISMPPDSRALALLVMYDPHTHAVAIARGENRGRTLAHRNVVRDVVELGTVEGGMARFVLEGVEEARAKGWAAAMLVQQGLGGPILGAARV